MIKNNKRITWIIIVIIVLVIVAVGYFITRRKPIPNVDLFPKINLSVTPIGTKLFSVIVPESWGKDETLSSGDSNFVISNPKGVKTNTSSEMIELIVVRKEKFADNYIDLYVDKFRQSFEKMAFKSNYVFPAGADYINGQKAFYIESDAVFNDIDMKKFSVLIEGKNKKEVWVITYTVSPGEWDKNKDVFYRSVQSFSLI